MNAQTSQLQDLSWPTVNHATVYHLGSFDPSQKGATHNRTSLEGNGLSVSMNPGAWREIARLGGEPLWEVSSAKPARFVDALSLEEEHWAKVMDWAVSKGYAQPTEIVRVSWYDEEADDRRYIEFDLADPGALAKAESEAEEYEDDDVSIDRHQGWSATPDLESRIGFAMETSMVRDMALTLYVEDVLHSAEDIQGIWWDETLDVHALSAPRGVIHKQALAEWDRRQVDEPSLGQDDDDLEDLNHQDHAEQLRTTGFWGKEAAGCLFLARDTGRLLIAHRSDEVLEPNTWGTWGGAMDRGESPEEAVLREVDEETEHSGARLALPLAVFSHDSGFRYHNFLVVVDEEFEPTLNWETQGYAWVDLDEIPSPLHPGVKYLLDQSHARIESLIETRGDLPEGLDPERTKPRMRP